MRLCCKGSTACSFICRASRGATVLSGFIQNRVWQRAPTFCRLERSDNKMFVCLFFCLFVFYFRLLDLTFVAMHAQPRLRARCCLRQRACIVAHGAHGGAETMLTHRRPQSDKLMGKGGQRGLEESSSYRHCSPALTSRRPLRFFAVCIILCGHCLIVASRQEAALPPARLLSPKEHRLSWASFRRLTTRHGALQPERAQLLTSELAATAPLDAYAAICIVNRDQHEDLIEWVAYHQVGVCGLISY